MACKMFLILLVLPALLQQTHGADMACPFECDGGATCLMEDQVCNAMPDCTDMTDEANCHGAVDCFFECDMKASCLNEEELCDGYNDCVDGTDEEDCDDTSASATTSSPSKVASPANTTAPATTSQPDTTAPATTSQPEEYHPDVVCDSSMVKVTVDKSRLSHLSTEGLHVGPNNNSTLCNATVDGDMLNFSFKLNECEPTVTSEGDDKIKFTYTIHAAEPTVGIITRKHDAGLSVSCVYNRTAVVDSHYMGNVTVIQYAGSAEGSFDFSMSLYHSTNLSSAFSRGDLIPVGSTVYAKVAFESEAAELNMYVQKCYASPTQTVDVTSQYSLIDDGGCISDDTVAPVSDAISGNVYVFQFDAFKFVAFGTSDVYLTCDLYLCKPESADDKCQNPRECGGTSRRSAADDRAMSYPVTFGPLSVL